MDTHAAYENWSASYDSDWNLTRDLDQMVTRNILGQVRFQSIVEIGCGTGKNTVFLATIGTQVVALDFSPGMIRRAKDKASSNRVSYAIADITKPWPCKNQSADLIVCNLVLEHIENLYSVFAEASRTLMAGGCFFICELHPFRQYQGTKAAFSGEQVEIEIPAFVHHISDFLAVAEGNGFTLTSLKEWWGAQDQNKPPRLLSFMFRK
jgi:ubiquinone/menaquinone biosynthesis C-methylase UbiE